MEFYGIKEEDANKGKSTRELKNVVPLSRKEQKNQNQDE